MTLDGDHRKFKAFTNEACGKWESCMYLNNTRQHNLILLNFYIHLKDGEDSWLYTETD